MMYDVEITLYDVWGDDNNDNGLYCILYGRTQFPSSFCGQPNNIAREIFPYNPIIQVC